MPPRSAAGTAGGGRRASSALQARGGPVEPIALEVLDAARVGEFRQRRVDGHLRQQGQTVAVGGLLRLALAEEVDLLAAVGTGEVAHVLNQTDDGDVHHLRHLHGLLDDHADQILRRGDDDHAVDGQGLEHVQCHVARSRRHVDEHIVDIVPAGRRPRTAARRRR